MVISKSKLWMLLLDLILFAVIIVLILLESFMAVLQAYVFTVLSCIYLKDALELGH